MKYTVLYKESVNSALDYVLSMLPNRIRTGIYSWLETNKYELNELRFKKNTFLTVITGLNNVKTDVYVTENDIESILFNLCDGSIYAHFDTIKNGYIRLKQGARAGICGRASEENGLISGISDITSINIRIPKLISGAGDYLYSFMSKSSFNKSVLLYSLPGIGKTTILRDFSLKLSQGNKFIRYAIIDTREEITPLIAENIIADVYLSYPKGLAIELATKSMTPELIICDEISSTDEASAILRAANTGVTLLATAHAGSFYELIRKESIKMLIDGGVFEYFIGIDRKPGEKMYKYTLNSCEEI